MLDRTQSMHLVVLCDSPGFMVGPTHEKEGGLRIFAEFFEVMAKFGEGGGRIFAGESFSSSPFSQWLQSVTDIIAHSSFQ